MYLVINALFSLLGKCTLKMHHIEFTTEATKYFRGDSLLNSIPVDIIHKEVFCSKQTVKAVIHV